MSRKTKPKPENPTYAVLSDGSWLRNYHRVPPGRLVVETGLRPIPVEHRDVRRARRSALRRRMRETGALPGGAARTGATP